MIKDVIDRQYAIETIAAFRVFNRGKRLGLRNFEDSLVGKGCITLEEELLRGLSNKELEECYAEELLGNQFVVLITGHQDSIRSDMVFCPQARP